MRTTLAYTSARILLLVVSVILLYLVGARGLLLLALACVVSGIASFVLLSRQRDVMLKCLDEPDQERAAAGGRVPGQARGRRPGRGRRLTLCPPGAWPRAGLLTASGWWGRAGSSAPTCPGPASRSARRPPRPATRPSPGAGL